MKLVKSIVDDQCRLIGFFIEGKESEFGGFTSNKATKAVNIPEMARLNFHNKQLAMNGTTFTEIGGFKINELPMAVLANGQFIDIKNTIDLLKRYIKDEKPIGFDVRLGDGTVTKMTYPAVVQLAKWFKPSNFMVRTTEAGKTFVSGKPGVMKLSQLPTEIIGAKPTTDKPKRIKSGGTPKTAEVVNQLMFDRDIISLYEIIRANGGVIINLPTEKYKKNPNASAASSKTSAEFRNLGIGEVGSPYLSSSESKMNANTTFKQIGVVNVEVAPNTMLPVNTYTIKARSVFRNGENNMKRFGIAISKDGAQQVVNTFGDSLALTAITDESIIKPITQLIFNGERKEFMEVDTSKIALIAPSKVGTYVMSNGELRAELHAMVVPKLISKYLSKTTGLMRDLKKEIPLDGAMGAMGKEKLHIFSAFKDEMVSKIAEAGIDLYTGAFTKTSKVEAGAAKSHGSASDDGDTTSEVEIIFEYALEGVNYKKLTYSVISSCGDELPDAVKAVVTKFSSMPRNEETMKLALATLEKAEHELEKHQYKIWLHKCATFTAGNKVKVHTHNSDKWELNIKSRAKASVYNCTEPGCTDVIMALTGVEV